jgi:hypothetical protein
MNIREINKPVTAQSLNESLAKRFGERIKLESFTLEQLQDIRNKLRTKLSQVETNESFDSVTSSENYQKNRLFLDVLNAEISERADVDEGKDQNKDGKKDFDDVKIARMKASGMSHDEAVAKVSGKKKKTDEAKKAGAPAEKPYKLNFDKGCKPGFVLDSKTGMCMPKAPKGMSQAQFNNESIVREGAEDQAELVMAAKDMVDRVTGWMEDTAEMQTESMLELADAIRDEKGQEQSDSFVNTVKPALESLYAAMETTRGSLTQGVGMLTGEVVEPMGDEEVPAEEPEMEPTVDAEVPAEDDFAAAAPAAGGEEEAGREKRESKELKKKMIESSRRLGTIFSKKK